MILLGFSIFIYTTAQKGVSDSVDTMMKIISIDAIPDLKSDTYLNAKDIASELMEEFAITPLYVKIVYYNKIESKVEYETASFGEKTELFDISLNEKGHLNSIYYFDKNSYRVSSMLLLERNNTKIFLQLATTKKLDSPYLDTIITSLLIANPVILILFLFIANILINRTMQPVKNIVNSVNLISVSELSNRLDTNNIPSEVKSLVTTFNNLLVNLEEAFKRISSFSADASHELKTPLTVIRGEVEVALRKDRTKEEYEKVLNKILKESIYVQNIINQLFLITKKDTQELHKNFKELYLDEIILDTIDQLKNFALSKFITLKIQNIIPITIYANEVLLKTAISNVIRNSIIYSGESTQVVISLSQEDSKYVLSIEDQGCGISQENLPYVFDRFYRVNKARSRKNGGTGLGLSLVKMIFDIHNYDISITSELNKGTKVLIYINK